MLLFFSSFGRNFVILVLLTQLTYISSTFEIGQDIYDDFKTLMMYFNEPLLTDASIRDFMIKQRLEKGASFEGANSNIMAKKLAEIIATNDQVADVDRVAKLFGENLENGRNILKSIVFGKNDIDKNVKALQSELLKGLEQSNSQRKSVVLPFGWGGSAPHAIALIIEKNARNGKGNTFNLIVANTGDGINYHYATKDPNEVYPELRHLWIRFEKIPEDVIFSGNNWFMYPLIALNDSNMVQEIENVSSSAKHYFYGSILNNFAKYMVIDKNEKRLLPYQRSGSCTLSSLMAALLYSSKDLSTFYENRVIIGQKMLKEFFIKYENNVEFKKLISDSFDLISRKLMRSSSSALAHQILLYLEETFPDSFLHAGLIGAGRSKWINEKKTSAIKVIKINTNVRDLVKASVDMGKKVEDFIKNNKIDPESSHINIHTETKTALGNVKYYGKNGPKWNSGSAKNVRDLLNLPVLRPKIQYKNFAQIKFALKNCKDKAGDNILICVRDTFEQCDRKDWWAYLNETTLTSIEFSGFLDTCRDILKLYIRISTVPNSLDDLVTLAYLQIASWKSAVRYDELSDHLKRLNFANFKPPSVLDEVMKQITTSLTSNAYSNWPIKTNFDSENLDKLNYLLKNIISSPRGLRSSSVLQSFCDMMEKYV